MTAVELSRRIELVFMSFDKFERFREFSKAGIPIAPDRFKKDEIDRSSIDRGWIDKNSRQGWLIVVLEEFKAEASV